MPDKCIVNLIGCIRRFAMSDGGCILVCDIVCSCLLLRYVHFTHVFIMILFIM